MRRHQRKKRKKPTEPEFIYDPSVWQFQLMPVDEMDFEEFIAMAEYYANESSVGGKPDCADDDEKIESPF